MKFGIFATAVIRLQRVKDRRNGSVSMISKRFSVLFLLAAIALVPLFPCTEFLSLNSVK